MKFFDTALELEFEPYDESKTQLLQDFNQGKNLILNKWKKLAAKADFSEGEELLFNLLLSLKDDIIRLEKLILNEDLRLENKALLKGLSFEGLKFEENCLKIGESYYVKIFVNHQKISFFIRAISEDEAEISQIKKEDKALYDSFVVDIQRQIINKRKDEK